MPRGQKAPWSDEDRVLQTALELARRPLGSSVTGGYRQAIDTVQRTLDTMNRLQGEELRRFADRHFSTKPELAAALTSLQKLEAQAQQHFRTAYLRQPSGSRLQLRRAGTLPVNVP